MVDGIAHELGQRGGESVELLAGGSVSRHQSFGHARLPHYAPLVVVGGKPKFREVEKPAVGVDFFGHEMTMIVENRKVPDGGIKPLRRGGGQQITVRHKSFHKFPS